MGTREEAMVKNLLAAMLHTELLGGLRAREEAMMKDLLAAMLHTELLSKLVKKLTIVEDWVVAMRKVE
jgi:hypothetical protein